MEIDILTAEETFYELSFFRYCGGIYRHKGFFFNDFSNNLSDISKQKRKFVNYFKKNNLD